MCRKTRQSFTQNSQAVGNGVSLLLPSIHVVGNRIDREPFRVVVVVVVGSCQVVQEVVCIIMMRYNYSFIHSFIIG